MGGAFANEIFRLNCAAWADYPGAEGSGGDELPRIRLAPMTGAVQNIGYGKEGDFYPAIVDASLRAGVGLSIGDGCPDEKLLFGIQALRDRMVKGAVVIKPYSNAKILERLEWASDVAEIAGVDIDSWRILTMRGLVELFRKSAADLLEIKRAAKVPFLVKGIFHEEDVELVRELRPDMVVVSNHGGRVETDVASTAAFLARHGAELARFAGEVWVDGGLRTRRDLQAARALGAREVLIGRPFVTALVRGGPEGIARLLAEKYGIPAAK
jgi:isopentenyl diphosphate isomerase/L-lactate dehydrogenase-like FMN-dependent dehydrogenase